MSNYKSVKTLLKRLIGTENTINNNILFIDFAGSIEKGQYLSQLYYWSARTKIPGGWIAKRHEEWFKEIRVKPHSIRRFSKEFNKRGFLEMKLKKFDNVTMPHYKLDQDSLIEQLITFCEGNKLSTLQIVNPRVTNCQPSQGNKLSSSINRDYTETITEIESASENKITKEDLKDFEMLEMSIKQERLKTQKETPSKVAQKVSIEEQILPNWMQVAMDMAEYLKGDGADQWVFLCEAAGGHVDPITITTAWAGKNCDASYPLKNWKNHIPKLTNWIRNELKSNSLHKKKEERYSAKSSTSERLKVKTNGLNRSEIKISKVPV